MTVIDFMKRKKDIILNKDDNSNAMIINPRLELLNILPRIREIFSEEKEEDILYSYMSEVFDRYSICHNHYNRYNLLKYLLDENDRYAYRPYTCRTGNILFGATFTGFDIFKKEKIAYLEELNVISDTEIEIKIVAYYKDLEKLLEEYKISIDDLDNLTDYEIIELLKKAKYKYSKIPFTLKESRIVTMDKIKSDYKNIYSHIVDVDIDLINFIPNINHEREENYEREDLLIYNRLVNILKKHSIFRSQIYKLQSNKDKYEMNTTGEVKNKNFVFDVYEYGEDSYLEGNTLTCFYHPDEGKRIFIEELEVVSKDKIIIKRIIDFGKLKKSIFKNKIAKKRFNKMHIKSKIDFLKKIGKKYESKISKYPKYKTLLIKDNKIIELKTKSYKQKDNLLILD